MIKFILTGSIALNLMFISFAAYKIVNRHNEIDLLKSVENAYWKDKVSQFEILNSDNSHKICFAGDSFFDRFNLSEFLHGYDVYNRSIGRDFTKTLLKRFEATVLKGNPDLIVLYIGGNDIAHGVSIFDIATHIKKIIAKTKADKRKIVILGILPRGKKYKPSKESVGTLNNRIIRLNQSIRLLCKEQKVDFLDYSLSFKNNNGFLEENFSNDGIHLNGKGYHVLSNLLKNYLSEAQLL